MGTYRKPNPELGTTSRGHLRSNFPISNVPPDRMKTARSQHNHSSIQTRFSNGGLCVLPPGPQFHIPETQAHLEIRLPQAWLVHYRNGPNCFQILLFYY